MAKLVGVVSKVVGQVFAVGSDGGRRPLVEGDRLFAGEQLETGAAGAVAVRLHNGAELTLGRDSSLTMTSDLLANQAPHAQDHGTAPSDAQLSDVERIQQAIAAGDDPTQSAEATAAGPSSSGAPGALGGGHSFVMLTEVAARVDPTVGFPTAGFNLIPELATREIAGTDPSSDDNGDVLRPTPPQDENNPVELQGLDLAPSELTFSEANLADGSASDPSALTQSGSFTVVAQDGVFNLSVGGINVVTAGVVTGVGQSIITAQGNLLTITGYNPTTGVVTYSYTLTGAEQHGTGEGVRTVHEHFPVLVSDRDGDIAQGSLDVNIRDDAPKAHDDSNAVTATEQHTALTGNVLGNDVQGADRVVGGPVIAGTFTGTYGTLVLAADGSYTYTLNTNDPDFKNLGGGGNGLEHFTYTIKDADGDTSSATLTLNISNLNDPVTLDGLEVQGGELNVYEKHLGDGSAPNASELTQQGTFKVTAPDGLQSLSVGGIAVVTGGVPAGFPQSVVTPEGHTLTITGYDPATGVVSYSYTLTDNESHANGDGTNSFSEHFQVIAKDVDGSTATGSLDVNIVDDVPKAYDDSNAVTATEQHTALTGNVLGNDVQGADRVVGGPVIAGTFTGTYGTLVLAADGSYTYTLNTNDPDFKNLGGGGNGLEHFTYTIKDADGDTSSATLTLNISNLNDPVTLDGLEVQGGELNVYEKHLGDGSAPNASELTQQGTFKVTAPDGLQSLSVGGIAVVTGGVPAGFPQSVVTPEGHTLTITGYDPATGVVSYSYTLTDNESHANGDGTNSFSEHFQVIAKDVDGSTATGSLDVNIVDDVPKAYDDSNAVTATEQHTALTGNVLGNDVQGADRVVGGPVIAGTFTGTYGTLVLAADGSYTYTLNTNDPDFKNLGGGGNGLEHFTYTIKDADGDTSSATLTLNISNLNDPVTLDGLEVQGGELNVYEKHLGDGSAPNASELTQQGTFKVTAPDGLQSLSVGGIAVVTGGVPAGFPQSVVTPEGHTLTITGYDPATGVVSYSYTLTDNESHANGDGTNSFSEHFQVIAKDVDGSTATGSLDVNIVDDVPKAVADSAAVHEGGTVTGNVLYNDTFGADTLGDGKYVVGVRAGSDTSTSASGGLGSNINGQYGYLTLDANGNGVYHAYPDSVAGSGATDTFVYTIRDADGDESTATITINVQGVCLVACKDGDITVYENALDTSKDGNDLAPGTVIGSHPSSTGETASGTLVGSVSGGIGALTYSLVGNASGQFGQIQINPDGTYTYTLTSPANTPGAEQTVEHFTYKATDALGNSVTSTIAITIVDDLPKAYDDSNAVTATEQHTALTGNVLGNDVQGADRVVGGPVIAGTFTGTYGTLVLAADGSYTYTLNTNDPDFKNLGGGGNGLEHFTYTIKDADGDTSSATLTLNISNLNDPVTLDGLEVQGGELNVYEKHLGDGSAPNASELTQQGTFKVTAPDGLQSLSVGGIAVVTGGVPAGFPQSVVTPEGHTLTITGYDPATGVVSYSYTLTDNESHANGDGTNSFSEHFQVIAKDVDGSTATGSLDVNIVDDVPKAVADSAAVHEGGTVTGNVLYNDTFGADTLGDGKYVVGVRAGSDTSTSASGGLGSNINGQYGYLTLDANGNGVYHAYPDSVAGSGATDTFVYTIRDADGDESTATITINVQGVCLVACKDGDITVYENALNTGSNPASTAETASGSLVGSVSGGVGPLTYSLVGNATGQYGHIQVNPDGTYTYNLTSPANTPGAEQTVEHFTYKATDALGNSVTSTIVITVVDDVPKAVADSAAVHEGGTVTGNVLYNDTFGADTLGDGKYVVGVRAGSDTSTSASGGLGSNINGQYGYLTLDANGNGVYHAYPDSVAGSGATDTFVYTIRDADGDESTATITINVQGVCLVACKDGDITVYENALNTGSNPASTAETASGSLVGSVSGGVGPLTYSLVGNATGQYGHIQVNPDGTYTYNLTSPANTPGAEQTVEHFTYKATDALGNSVTSTIVITVVDDVPKAVADSAAVHEGGTVTGNVLYNDTFGADTLGDGKYVVGVRAGSDTSTSASGGLGSNINGQYGYLTLDANGNGVYHAYPDSVAGSGATDTFVYTIRDADGDESTATITINVQGVCLVACKDGDITVYENALNTGSNPASTAETASGSLVGSVSGGVGPLTYSLVGNATGQYGHIQVNPDGTYTYNLTSPANTPGAEQTVEHFTYKATDALGNSVTSTIVITVVDDVPKAHCDTVSVYEGSSVTGNVLWNDVVGADTLGDGKYVVGVRAGHDTSTSASGGVGTNVNGQYGYLTLDADGNGVYHAYSNSVSKAGATDTFVYTIRDADGDESTTTITINVQDKNGQVCGDEGVQTLGNGSGQDKNGNNSLVFESQVKALDRSAFITTPGVMTAALVVLGYLGPVGNANAEDVFTVSLRKGETLKLDHDRPDGNLTMEWKDAGGSYQPVADGGSFTASHDGVYSIHLVNPSNASGNSKAAENYKLSLVVDYANAENGAQHSGYTMSEHHGSGASGTLDLTYQGNATHNGSSANDVLLAGEGNNTLNGNNGHDVLVGGAGNDSLYGGNGDDLLIGGAGNDVLDGGNGIDTASYASATGPITVNLSMDGAQNTGGAGVDTLARIENLIGSDYGDTLIGSSGDNVLDGGLGNDMLNGGSGQDTLIGGPGNDTLTGGIGNDTFVWHKGDAGHDTVTDFTPGSDHLDLSQLLQGEHATAASLDDYLHFKVSGTGTNVVSTIEVSSVAGAPPTQTIDLAGVDLAQHYGVTAGAGGVISAGPDTATIINGMLNDHSLKVDTV
ncbi:retention module-containing protein [Pseudomonas sp. SK2]|uniref:retention module-containing protein n=3 Tax=unclassified Pseudomonas TaxID=196821 RepID=UPI00192C3861|nr:retention module-containing protein [Pseudomonas sp. SK2]QQZ34975.1 retention module-containing protein [Pseudomonas sp. SK2]